MGDRTILGTFGWGGVAYYQWRDYLLAALVAYSCYFFRFRLAYQAFYLKHFPISVWVFSVGGLLLLAFAFLRRKIREEVSIDYERGQVVKRRDLFGLEQIVQLANLESIVGIAQTGMDVSLRGHREPRWVGFLVLKQGRTVPISLDESSGLGGQLEKLAQSLDVPFHSGTLEQRISVDREGKVEFLTPPRRVGLFRSVFFFASLILVTGFYLALILLIKFFLFQ